MKLPFFKILIFIILIHTACVPEKGLDPNINYELYVTEGKDQTPAVSPDGNWIAYYHEGMIFPEPEEYPTGLYIMDINGNNRRLLLEGAHWSPSWSPDGEWLVFTSAGVIQIINFEGDSIRTFEGINNVPLFFPDWSTDGTSILFSSNYVNGGGGFICTPNFTKIHQIYNQYEISAYNTKWAGGIEKFVCSVVSHDWEGEEIFIVDTALNNPVRLTFNNKTNRDPDFSSKNNLIVWSSSMTILRMNIDGTEQKYIDYGRYPTWTPDGNYIIYSNANKNITKEVIWKIDINGTNKTQLTF